MEVPYSAANAADRRASINAAADKAMQEVKNLKLQWERDKQDLELKRRLQEGIVKAQELVNQLQGLEVPGAEASASFYKQTGAASKGASMLRDLLTIIRSIR